MTLSDLEHLRKLIEDEPAWEAETATAAASETEFFVSNPPVSEASEEVRVDGVVKATPADYVIGDRLDRIIFAVPPGADAQVQVSYARQTFADEELDAFLELAGADWAPGTVGRIYRAGVLTLDALLTGAATALDFSPGGGDAPEQLTTIFDRLVRWRAVLSQQLAAESARPFLITPTDG